MNGCVEESISLVSAHFVGHLTNMMKDGVVILAMGYYYMRKIRLQDQMAKQKNCVQIRDRKTKGGRLVL